MYFPDWLLLQNNERYSFLHVFSWLDSSFIFYQWIICHFLDSLLIHSPHWRTVQLLLSFVNLNKAPITSMLMYFVNVSFQFTWVNIKERDCWIVRLSMFSFFFFCLFLNFKIFNSYMRSQTWTPPPTSLPTASLWVIPMHQPQACCTLRQT